MMGARGRLRAGATLALGGGLTLLGALLAHEWLIFGPSGYDLIADASDVCAQLPCVNTGTIVTAHIAKAVAAAILFAAIGSVWTTGKRRWGMALTVWLAQYLWALIGIASSHRAAFRDEWRWWEPFAVLMWSPVATPGFALIGVGLWYGLDRAGRRLP